MQIPPHIKEQIELTHTFGWLAVSDDKLRSELCRTSGTRITDEGHLKAIIIPSMAVSLIDTLKSNLQVAVTVANALTMESYQLKGHYMGHSSLSADEEVLKASFMQGMHDVLTGMGFDYGDRFAQYADLEGLAVSINVQAIFEQTPRIGTGGAVISKEVES